MLVSPCKGFAGRNAMDASHKLWRAALLWTVQKHRCIHALGLSACVVQVIFVGFKSQLLYCAIKFKISLARCLLTRSSWLERLAIWIWAKLRGREIPNAKFTNKHENKQDSGKNRSFNQNYGQVTYSFLVMVPSGSRTSIFGRSLQSEPGATGM